MRRQTVFAAEKKMADYKLKQVRLLRDWILDAESERFRAGSIGKLYVYEEGMEVQFADWDAIGWEEGKSAVGYPGFSPRYDWGTEADMEDQFGPGLFVIEELTPETIRKFEDHERVMNRLFAAERDKRSAVIRVWGKFAAYKQRTRKKWATIRKQSAKASLAKSPKSGKKLTKCSTRRASKARTS